MRAIVTGVLAVACVAGAAAQQLRYDDVVRNLRNPDERARKTSLELLRESKYTEAIEPIAPLVNDPVDAIQLSAIETELSFYLVDEVSARKRVAFVVEVRGAGKAETAFASGPLAVWPRPVPAELLTQLLKAVDDEHPKVRVEAIYTLGAIAPRLPDPQHQQALVRALDHYDPAIRTAAARVSGRLRVTSAGTALFKAVNDSQESVRFAAMRALGQIGDEMAVQALGQQLDYYKKGEGAWSALDALAHVAHPSSVPSFKARLADKDPFIRRSAAEGLGRAGDTSELATIEAAATRDSSDMVRAAMWFALQKFGRDAVMQLADLLASDRLAPQIGEYFLELGPATVPALVPHLKSPKSNVRGNVAVILGAIGDEQIIAALEPLVSDRDRDVARAAQRAIERIRMRFAPAA